MCDPCKTGDNHAERHTVSKENSGGVGWVGVVAVANGLELDLGNGRDFELKAWSFGKAYHESMSGIWDWKAAKPNTPVVMEEDARWG